ncbi:hypothetical protein AA0Y32_03575 [Georgenia phoenicis]|uniref:hypothetical protein n=1 Tax=unclassified Georgenia TaxID=2626815 RepID=UPI0039B07913
MSLPAQSSPRSVRVAVVLAAVLLLAGVWGTFVREVAVGWPSSMPLVSGAPRMVVLDTPGVLFLLALVVGAVLLAGAAGYRWARR